MQLNFNSNIQYSRNDFFQMRDQYTTEALEDMIQYIGDAKNKTMIEIGSYTGESTTVFAKYFKKVISIDPFINDYDPNDEACKMADFEDVYKKFIENTKQYPNIEHIRKTSDEAVLDINEKVDFVYVDGMHTFNQVTSDIINYKQIVKQGGHIGGHDYNPQVWAGVVEAVNKTLGQPDQTFKDTSWIKKI